MATTPDSRPRFTGGRIRPAFARSLAWRLPLSISAIIAVVLASLLWAAHREVERTLVAAGGMRAQQASQELASLLERSVQQSQEELNRLAASAEVRAALAGPDEGSRLAAIGRFEPRETVTPRRFEAWTAAGTRVLEVDVPGTGGGAALPAASGPPPAAGVRLLRSPAGTVFAEHAVDVGASPSERLGSLLSRSIVAVNPPGILAQMVGSDATVALGDGVEHIWTDLATAVTGPPIDVTQNGVHQYRATDGTERLGAVSIVRGTRLAIWVEFPHALIVAPAREFLNRMLAIGGLAILVGAGLVRAITGRLTTPLAELTTAAEDIASGDYARRVAIERDDEIGRLGKAFDVMGAQIEEGRRALQVRVLEQSQTLEALRESEARHRAIVTVAFDSIITIDLQGLVTEFNPAAERTFGYTRAEAVGRELAELIVPPASRAAHRAGLARFAATGEGRVIGRLIELVAMRADGTEFPVELAITPIPSDERPMLTGVVHDLTQRRRSEQALAESERAYRSTFEDAPVGIAHVALDGRWLRVNERLCELVGYSQAELLATSLDALAHGDHEGRDAAAREQVLAGAVERYTDVRRLMRSNESLMWANLTLSLHRDAAAAPQYFIVILEDITDRRQLEEQLRQSQKMEAIGQLAGGVAHDFNNLLTAILGYSGLLLEQFRHDAPVHELLREIQKAGETASSLTSQLLALSRRQVLQPQTVNLNEIVQEMDTLLRRVIGEDITLTTRLADPLDVVHVDPGQVKQIILNLAVNARDAMPGGGQLIIETANVHLDEQYAVHHAGASSGPHAVLVVSDTGTGMSAETIAHIFEPFFTTKPRGEGTGLGLATTYGIVKQSGGSIWVYSELGHGTTFKVYFRRATQGVARPLPPVAESESADVGGTETILVAEDQAEVRALVRRALTRHGYTVLEASTGAEALAIARERAAQPIDLLLTDVIMPGMSGRELAAELQRAHPAVRVLFASGYTDDVIVRQGKLPPTEAFLQKPFTPRSLAAKVRAVLDGRY